MIRVEIRRPIEFPMSGFEIERASCHESRMGKTHFSKTGEIFQDARLVCQAWEKNNNFVEEYLCVLVEDVFSHLFYINALE